MKTLLIKENHCLIQCSTTLTRIQVNSYRWIWSGTFQERWLHQTTSIGHCHSNTAFWTKAGGADCRTAHWSEKRSSIQDAHLPRERNGYVIISPMWNVTFTKGKGPIFLSWLHYRRRSTCNIATIRKQKAENQKNLDNIWAALDSGITPPVRKLKWNMEHQWINGCKNRTETCVHYIIKYASVPPKKNRSVISIKDSTTSILVKLWFESHWCTAINSQHCSSQSIISFFISHGLPSWSM